MVTPAVVKQRLKLADVSPKLHDIYAEDGMTLDQLMAFSVDIEPVWGFNFSIASPTRRIVSRASSAAWGSGPAISSSRSEEHTSALQSLMRISYAVSCWTTKKQTT